MPGNKAGAIKRRAYMIEQYGSVENYKAAMKRFGAKGGRNGKTEGFAHGKIDATEAINKRWRDVEKQRRIGGKED